MAGNKEVGTITAGSARELRQVIKYYRGLLRGDEGAADGADSTPDTGPWLGICTSQISQGTSGPVDFYVGWKGGEHDSGLSVQVYSRFITQPQNQIVVFDLIDRGYEIVYPNYSQTTGTTCTCSNCLPQGAPTVTGCSNCNPAATYWAFSFNPSSIPICCTDCQYTGPIVLQNNSGCTWTSGPITCNGTTTLWTLTIDDPVTLIMTVGDNSGGSAGTIEYRTSLTGFSGMCNNVLYLWEPTSLPEMPRQAGQATCSPPCEICLSPWPTLTCGECNSSPTSATVQITGASGGLAASFNGITGCTGSPCTWTGTTSGGGTVQVTRSVTGNSPNEVRQYQVTVSTTVNGNPSTVATYTVQSNALPCDTTAVTVGNLQWQVAQSGSLPSTVTVTLHS